MPDNPNNVNGTPNTVGRTDEGSATTYGGVQGGVHNYGGVQGGVNSGSGTQTVNVRHPLVSPQVALAALWLAIVIGGIVWGSWRLWDYDEDWFTYALLAGGALVGIVGCVWLLLQSKRGRLLTVIFLLLTIAGTFATPVASYVRQQNQPPIVILVADFAGPELIYGVTDRVLERLRAALQDYPDVAVIPLRRIITVDDGSAVADAEGNARGATIVIWGSYNATDADVLLSAHFELLRPPKVDNPPQMDANGNAQPQVESISELKSFALQTELSNEMAYLSLFSVGMTRYAAKDWEGASAGFTSALSQTNELKLVPILEQGTIYLYRGSAYDSFGDEGHAIADYSQAINLNPNDADAYYNRGVAYSNQKEYDQSIKDNDQAIKLKPNYADAYNNRGNAYSAQKEYDQAIKDYDQAIRLKSNYAEAYYNRGLAYYYQKDYAQAVKDYTEAIRLKSDFADAHNNRGNAYSAQKEYDQAIKDYDEAITLKPDDVYAYVNRGAAYAEQKEYDQAITDFTQAIKLKPDFAEAYYDRALAYERRGEKPLAINDYKKVLELSQDVNLRQQAAQALKDIGANPTTPTPNANQTP